MRVSSKGSGPIAKRDIVAQELAGGPLWLAGIWAELEVSSRLTGACFRMETLARSSHSDGK
jgi:hypothetical protein